MTCETLDTIWWEGRWRVGTPSKKREKAWRQGNLFDCLEAHFLHIPGVPGHISLEHFSLDGREGPVD